VSTPKLQAVSVAIFDQFILITDVFVPHGLIVQVQLEADNSLAG
jgi:hypothetical protein